MGTSPFWMRTRAKTKGSESDGPELNYLLCDLLPAVFCTTGMTWGLPQGSEGRPASSPFCIV